MALETVIKPEGINIKDLSISNPAEKAKVHFDPIRDMSDEDWEIIKQESSSLFGSDDKLVHFTLDKLVRFTILDPEKSQELRPKFFATVRRDVLALKYSKQRNYYARNAKNLKILFPEEFLKPEYYDNEAWEGMAQQLENLSESALNPLNTTPVDLSRFVQYAIDMKIIDPHKFEDFKIEKSGLFNSIWDRVSKSIENVKSANFWYHFTYEAGNAKLLFPEKVQQLKISGSDWEHMLEYLDTVRKSDEQNLDYMVFNMAVLAAEKVIISDKGLRLIMPRAKDTRQAILPEFPDVRKF